ncbi:MAG: 50S ribosomal protein L16 [Patescibacteria group bacterium]
MLIPKKVKYRKTHKGVFPHGHVATDKTELAFGPYGLKSLTSGWVSSQQLEAARRVLTRYVKRGGKIWIRVFPDRAITKKGNEVVMGAGKGTVDHYVAVVRPGTIVFEMDGITEPSAKEALEGAAYKLSTICKYVHK